MKVIYFYDIKCKQPYTFETLSQRAIGGTESTLLRVANELCAANKIYIIQANRKQDEFSDSGISYIKLETAKSLALTAAPDYIVLIRKIKMLDSVCRDFPTAKPYLWIQDLPVAKYARYRHILVKRHATLICNSFWQQQQALKYLSSNMFYQRIFHPFDSLKPIKSRVIYNVIDPGITYKKTRVDKNKLVFFSAPRKGLRQVLDYFGQVLKQRPETRLYIANPGYEAIDKAWINHPNLINLGSLSNAEVISHVREAFCVFYPQTMVPETFGVVYAEANTVGTPVLCYDIGAASEILNGDGQVMAVGDVGVVERLMEWYREARPKVATRNEYALDVVVKKWQEMLEA